MEKETFILQTTRTGRLPTNASFTDEGVARAETERAQVSGAFEHIKLVSMIGADRRVLFEIGAAQTEKASDGRPIDQPDQHAHHDAVDLRGDRLRGRVFHDEVTGAAYQAERAAGVSRSISTPSSTASISIT
jgi:hypothetical protein